MIMTAITDNGIGDEGAKKVSESLTTNSTLTKLSLESNSDGISGMM